jgi:hypothetical protein
MTEGNEFSDLLDGIVKYTNHCFLKSALSVFGLQALFGKSI